MDIDFTSNSNLVAKLNDTEFNLSRKGAYNTSLNADAGLIPTSDYDLTSKKYVDDSITGFIESSSHRRFSNSGPVQSI